MARCRGLSVLSMISMTVMLVPACDRGTPPTRTTEPATTIAHRPRASEPNPLRNAYFGDLHVHTGYSFDAFLFTTRATPDDAYRYARGGAIDHPAGFKLQLKSGPLDFLAVTDHAMFLGVLPAMADPSQEISRRPLSRRVIELARRFAHGETRDERREAFQGLWDLFGFSGEPFEPGLLDLDVVRSTWQEIIEAAERHYEPGEFTTFIGYEYTSGPDFQNLHRNVIFRGGDAPEVPFSRLDSSNPEDLWAWMEANRAKGIQALAIPHNSNGSNGQMFRLQTFDGRPLDGGYAETRMRNEPIVEVTQVKGTSEVHPQLSPNDEWANFEIFPYRIGATIPSEPVGSYVREAYLNGLVLEEREGFNPFKFGVIGSSDTHNAGGSYEEFNYHSKIGFLDATPELRGSVPLSSPGPDGAAYADSIYRLWGASGLAGVWAEENTREAIFEAMLRKETFATSGPRIRIRFFAGYDFDDTLLSDPEAISTAYREGVPMGGDLVAQGDRSPRFLVWASRDPNSAPLQRLQIVKGWVDGEAASERVFDIACSDGLEPDPATRRCPDNGATVDLSDCTFSADAGAAELRTLWTDPEFDPGQRAFYYVRVLENPTCRWSTWDAIRTGVEPRPDLPVTIQERAWSSPIWYVPGG